MTTARVLNQAQAEAAYSAMCALNNVGGFCGDLILSEGLRVQWLQSVTVRDGLSGPREEYPNQVAFATAYGLNSDEWQSDVAAAAGGLTQTAIER